MIKNTIPLVLTIASTSVIAAPPTYDTANDTEFLRFHGRGDVLRTAEPFSSCSAFPSGGVGNDMGEYMHVRLRVRLAPESEYEILDTNHAVTGGHTTGRVLWTQGVVEYTEYAGFTVGYEHDSANSTGYLYLAIGDGGDTSSSSDARTRVWRVEVQLDDGEFHTIDWGYDESVPRTGLAEAFCWIDGTAQTVTQLTDYTGTPDPAVELNGSWHGGGSIMGNARADALHKLAGNGWQSAIGKRDEVWPDPNGPDSGTGSTPSPDSDYLLDTYTSAIGDVAYAAFRWAHPESPLSGTDVWDVELKLNGNLTDDAGGLNSGDVSLLSPEIVDSVFDSSLIPEFVDSSTSNLITRWVPTSISAEQQARYFYVYHHGLGDQTISVNEYNGSTSTQEIISKSIILCLEPDGEVGYFSGYTEHGYFSLVPNVAYYPVNGEHTITLPAGKPGLYRILVKSGENEGFEFETNHAPPYWGVHAPFGPLEGVSALTSDAFAYIPRDANPDSGDAFEFTKSNVSSFSEREFDGSLHLLLSSSGQFLNTPGIIDAGLSAGWKIESAGVPVAFSDDEFGAYYYIKGGVIEEDSFTLWSLDEKILRDRIVEIASTGLGTSSSIVDDFGDESTPGTFANQITSNPRDYFSLGTYPLGLPELNIAIHRQVTSTSENMVGSVHHDFGATSTRLDYGELSLSDNNADRFGPTMLFWAGWDDTAANPYYSDTDFDKRARVAMLAYARHIHGGRLRRSSRFENSLYGGLAGLAGTDELGIGMHWARVYGLFDADDRAAFLPAALVQFCQIANNKLTSTRNQDVHHLPFLYEIGELWETEMGSAKLGSWAEEFAQDIVQVPSTWTGEDVALYEAVGFDGSYSGIQNYMIAAGWLVSGDEFDPSNSGTGGDYNREWDFLRTVLNRQYDFWSHYMGSSPDGSQIAFGHDNDSRTTMGAVREQYSGAKRIGSLASDMAARLALEDGSDLADDLINDVWPGSLGMFPISTLDTAAWSGDPTAGTKFDLMPLYAGGLGHLFDASGPIDTGAELPSEVVATGVTVEVIDEAYIAINTPCYYAVMSIRESIHPYYYENAVSRHEEPRTIEDHDLSNGGGDHTSEAYEDGKGHAYSEEIGGVGLSLFVDKTTPSGNSPLIAGRNWSPLTTHQVVGFTSDGKRRWAEQNSRNFGFDTDLSGNPVLDSNGNFVLSVCYDLNDSDSDTSTHGYRVERVYTFKPGTIDVDVAVYLSGTVDDLNCSAISGTIETLDRLVENIPFELDESIIGATVRSVRLTYLDAETTPWGTQWDEWCNSDTSNDGLIYTGQEIGWLQKEIPVPNAIKPKSSLSYTIQPYYSSCSSTESRIAGGDVNAAVLHFIRAYEQGDRSADINQDGFVDVHDVRDFMIQFSSMRE